MKEKTANIIKLAVMVIFFTTVVTFLVYDANAKQPAYNGGGGGGGGISLGHWENYGTVVQSVVCVTRSYIINSDGTISVQVTYEQKAVYYLLENCDPGGNQCTLGTQRTTYQGGGC
ncbi:MAG: hypothetical protein ACP5US_12740 [Candidatus Kryptoniota bacterium]